MTAYFDNAATTFPKPDCVYEQADRVFRSFGVNTGRGDYGLATEAAKVTAECKDLLRKLLCCPGKGIAFTASATDALNRIIGGLGLSGGAAVYVSPFEHNAVTRILHSLEKAGAVSIRILPFDRSTLLLDEAEMNRLFESNPPELVVMTHASNVCGAILPVEDVFLAAKAYGAVTVVDMSQTAGLVPLNVGLETVDFAVFAGHKTLFGPFGIGGFVYSLAGPPLSPVVFGGNGINSVEQDMPADMESMIEVGSQNCYAIAGLRAACAWLLESGGSASRREQELAVRLLDTIRSHGNVHVVADKMACPRTGVVSVLFDGYSPSEMGSVLGDLGVAVRAGLHCAPYAHRFLGTLPAGTVRFSTSLLTTDDDFAKLEQALDFIELNG